jgi:agarase
MILGCRDDMASSGLPVAEASRGLVDVWSVNYYVPRAFAPPLKMQYNASRAPILITEWSFRSRDSGLPNTEGAGPVVATQADRADKYREYMTDLLAQPYVVGAHWFEYVDEPAEGRFDGENSNYGVVNIHDDPYTVFDAVVKQVNAQVYKIHGGK